MAHGHGYGRSHHPVSAGERYVGISLEVVVNIVVAVVDIPGSFIMVVQHYGCMVAVTIVVVYVHIAPAAVMIVMAVVISFIVVAISPVMVMAIIIAVVALFAVVVMAVVIITPVAFLCSSIHGCTDNRKDHQ
jgi:hypothetical protein